MKVNIFGIRVSILVVLSTFMVTGYGLAQKPKPWTAGEIYQNLEKLNVLASVLYVAAHPDDENTRLISFFSNHVKAQTTYLSITRGDGGQNLIGKEIDEKLGVLRTQELLTARSIDHGKQMFSRANDFGYSKNAEETIDIWDTEKIKADVTWAIRKSKPDVIINRFDHRTSGKTHGHHTASAILSLDMFDQSSDPKIFSEQLQFVEPWQARRIFFNTSWWFYGSQEKFEKADKTLLMGFDVGVYFPLLGKSNTEISAESRSQHKCQGFGSTGTRGSQMEYLEILKGDMPLDKQNIFDGINITWTRVKSGETVKPLVDKAIKEFNFTQPENSLPLLLEIYQNISKIEDDYWRTIKLNECIELIQACAGLFMEAKSQNQWAVPGNKVKLDLELTKRLPYDIRLKKIHSTFFNIDTLIDENLEDNQQYFYTREVMVPQEAHYTTPYWLWNKGSLGMYQVKNQDWIGLPETPKDAKVTFDLQIGEYVIPITKEVVYKFNSPEEGEVYRPFEILPAVSVAFLDNVYIFPDKDQGKVSVVITNNGENAKGVLSIPMPENWKCTPSQIEFDIIGKGQNQEFEFLITPPETSSEIFINPLVTIENKQYTDEVDVIRYDHIPYQMVQQKASAKCIRLDINTSPISLGYIPGAGDVTPEYLVKMGYNVTILSEEQIKTEILQKYNCIIFGVRAYNTLESLKFKQKDILKYIENGGKVVVQYNTANSLYVKEIGPYPFNISRERVTVEEAEMRFVNPKHAFLNYPNKISEKDFEHWVQERGLYFANDYDSQYETIFSCNDPGETPKEGSLIVANYGKGQFVYTGISFFRQFPAGVSGAYRLFANIITPSLFP